MTNGEKLRSMSDEDLAWFLCGLIDADFCGECPATDFCHSGHNGFETWLKKEADEA